MFVVFVNSVITSRLAPVASADTISGCILRLDLSMLNIFVICLVEIYIMLRNQMEFIGFLFYFGDCVQKLEE